PLSLHDALPIFFLPLAERLVPLQPGAQSVGVLAQIAFLDVVADPVTVVPVGSSAALAARRRSPNLGDCIVQEEREEVVIGALGRRRVTFEVDGHVCHTRNFFVWQVTAPGLATQ